MDPIEEEDEDSDDMKSDSSTPAIRMEGMLEEVLERMSNLEAGLGHQEYAINELKDEVEKTDELIGKSMATNKDLIEAFFKIEREFERQERPKQPSGASTPRTQSTHYGSQGYYPVAHCGFCGKRGHTTAECWWLEGPQGYGFGPVRGNGKGKDGGEGREKGKGKQSGKVGKGNEEVKRRKRKRTSERS